MLPLKPVSFTRLTAAFSTSSRVFVLLSQQLGSVLFGNPKIRDLQLYCACLSGQTHGSSFTSAHFPCLEHQSKLSL